MSVNRSANLLGQQRVDVPHLRAIESSIRGDFDLLAGTILGGRQALVISGFYFTTVGVTQPEALQITVADGILMHFYASESGSMFSVPADRANETLTSTNPRVDGSWTPSQTNYVGMDLVRSTDETTVDLVQFIDTTTLIENPKSVPLARTLDYRIVISTTDFGSNPSIAPLAKVVLDSVGAIVSVTDARNHCFRLGSGGTIPDPAHAYPWPAGRKEGSTGDPFLGGDKAIQSFKEWADALMTRSWELGGGEFWYASTADRNVKLARTGATFTSTGEHFEWDGTNLHWKGLVAVLSNCTAAFNEIADQATDLADLTNLADGECIYVDLDCSTTHDSFTPLTAVKGVLTSLGSPAVPGSRWVLAWRYGTEIYTRDHGWSVGSSFKLATIAAAGTVRVSANDLFPTDPTAVLCSAVGYAAIASGLTRGGGSIADDFVGGSGILTIGGQSKDQEIIIATTRSEDSVKVSGLQAEADGRATLEVVNAIDHTVSGDYNVKTLELQDFHGNPAHRFFSNGAMGFKLQDGIVSDGPSSGPLACKIFVRKDGTTPTAKDQLVIRFFNTSPPTEVILAESGNY